jgi:hypothetical protein
VVSTKDWRSHAGSTGLLLCTALIGCGGHALDSRADAGPASSHGGGSFGSSADAAASFVVGATASATAICKGQCVDLAAQASGGVAPYTYAWGGGRPSANASEHVCPDSTTTYSVIAQDASGAHGELAQTAATATASITVTVGETCAVAASDAGVTEIGEDAAAGSQVCIADWPQPPYLSIAKLQVATDAAGDTFLVVDYTSLPRNGSPALNLGSPSPAYAEGFAVAKLDASCHLQWVREFGGPAPGNSVSTFAAHTDAASEITVVGSFVGSADLGTGAVTTPSPSVSATAGFLLRLDESGSLIFSKTFITSQASALAVNDLAVTPDGTSTIALFAAPDTDFGSGPDVASELAGSKGEYYLVQFDPKGKLVYRKTVPSIDTSFVEIVSLATNASGSLWTLGFWTGSGNPGAIAQLTASAAENWKQMPKVFTTSVYPAAVGVGPSGQSVIWGEKGPVSLWAFSPTGAALWSTTMVSSTLSDGGTASGAGVAVDDSDNTTVAFGFSGTIQNGSQPPLVSAGGDDIGFQQVDAQGNFRAQGRFGGPKDETMGGVGVDPSGNVILAGWRMPPNGATGAAFTFSVFVVKIHP